MSSITDHRHGPWRAIAAVIHHRHGAHEATVEVAHRDEESIAAWLASGEQRSAAASRVPVMPHAEPRTFPPTFDDDREFSDRLNRFARFVHAQANELAAENDRRARRLLAWSGAAVARSAAAGVELAAWAGARFQPMRLAAEAGRRSRRNVAQTGELGELLAGGQLPPAAVVKAMVRRALHATNPAEDSAMLPRLTPPVLAELDRTLGMRKPQAPRDGSVAA